MWAGDRYGFVAGAAGTYDMICAYHPYQQFELTVVTGAAPTSPSQEDVRREDLVSTAVSRLPYIETNVEPQFVTNGDGTRRYSIQVGYSIVDPVASFHQFIPGHPIIDVGDQIDFYVEDALGVRGVLLNSSTWFQEVEPISGADYLQSWNRPGGGTISARSYYVFPYGDADNYTLGFLSSGWMTNAGADAIPGLGFLPSNFTVTFNEPGFFGLSDPHAGDCPTYAGPDCRAIMNGIIYVRGQDEIDSATGILLPLWGVLLVLASYF
jgi:hypothetical protein